MGVVGTSLGLLCALSYQSLLSAVSPNFAGSPKQNIWGELDSPNCQCQSTERNSEHWRQREKSPL